MDNFKFHYKGRIWYAKYGWWTQVQLPSLPFSWSPFTWTGWAIFWVYRGPFWTPLKIVPYLGFLADFSMEVFHLIPEKKHKFVMLVQDTLQSTYVSVKTLQRLVGKCTLIFLGQCLRQGYSQEKWMQPFLRASALKSRFCYVVPWERRFPMGYSWRLGITHYLSGMNDVFSSYGCICLRMGG